MDLDTLIANSLVKILDTITFNCKPKKEKITFISYRSNELPYGMKEISKEFNKNEPEIDQVYLTLKFTNTLLDKVKYAFELTKQVYHIKTSNVVFIDGNNFVISNINKGNTKVIQLWHASGAIKKFGCDYKRKYPIRNYDYMITSSRKNEEIMSSAFGMERESILPLGYADSDILLDNNAMNNYKEEFFNSYPAFKDKKIILYAPTFRGDAVYEKNYLNVDISSIKSKLSDEYALIYKMHPILGNIELTNENDVLNANHIDIYKLFAVADILVSDYSSIIYDFSLLEKPVVLYAPDLDLYAKDRGLYENYHTITPYTVTTLEDDLIDAIKECDNMPTEVKTELKREFFEHTDGKSAERIFKFALNLIRD